MHSLPKLELSLLLRRRARVFAPLLAVAAITACGKWPSRETLKVFPTPAPLSGVTAVEVVLGIYHGCARTDAGEVYCWGDARYGFGTADGRVSKVEGLPRAVRLSAGGATTCAILADTTARCWGLNDAGQVGDGTRTSRPGPVVLSGMKGVAQIALGMKHGCALTVDGRVWCWGDDPLLGRHGGHRLSPEVVPGLSGVVGIGPGEYHCARLESGQVWCWDDGHMAQSVPSQGNQSGRPRQVPGIKGNPYGEGDACPATVDEWECWAGQRCLCESGAFFGKCEPLLDPAPLSGATLSCGMTHACLLDSGEVRCWGLNDSNQLGFAGPDICNPDGRLKACSKVPRPVPGLGRVLSLHASNLQTCVLTASHLVACWGNGADPHVVLSP